MEGKPIFKTFEAPADSDLRSLLGSIESGRDRANAGGAKRVLVDLLALEREPGEIESLLLSHHVGVHLSRLDRIAVVIAHRTGMGERVAQHLGVNMRVFTSRGEAIAWLEEVDSQPDWAAP
jgi:hypothetical protein